MTMTVMMVHVRATTAIGTAMYGMPLDAALSVSGSVLTTIAETASQTTFKAKTC